MAEAVIILLLLIGSALLFFLLNRSKPISTLPVMPTYDPAFSTAAPVLTAFPSPQVNADPSATVTPTPAPVFIVNNTPVYPTASYNYPTPTLFFAPALTSTPPPARMGQTCKNILYPVVAGQQWSYQANATGRIIDLNMSVLSVNGSQGNVQVNLQPSGASKQVQVQCEGDVIRSFPFLSMDILFGNSINSSMTASYISGILAPNESAFMNNNWALAWSSQYLVSGNTILTWNNKQFDVALDNSTITLTCQTVGAGEAAFENVAVAAGSFRALKVVCSEQGPITATLNGIPVSGTVTGNSSQWFAPNIGLVKMQVDNAAVNILGVSFSIVSDNYLELKNYVPAP